MNQSYFRPNVFDDISIKDKHNLGIVRCKKLKRKKKDEKYELKGFTAVIFYFMVFWFI